MNIDHEMDRVLRTSLSSTETPSAALNARVLGRIQSKETATVRRPAFRSALIAAALLVCLTATAFAAIRLLTPAQLADRIANPALAEAFSGPDALLINKTQEQDGYRVTFMGLLSGKGLSTFDNRQIDEDRTYAVVAVEQTDDTKEPLGLDTSLFVSPLIRGMQPWRYNAASMKGSYIAEVIDGVLYRIVECDTVEPFANKGLYLCVSTTDFYDIEAYDYDAKTGDITPRDDFDGLNVLFDLPIDASKADASAAAAYVEAFESQPTMAPLSEEDAKEAAMLDSFTPADGERIDASFQTLVPDAKGFVHFQYEGYRASVDIQYLFTGGATGFSKERMMFEDDSGRVVLLYELMENGDITAALYRMK